jgi:hypothetical protein
MLFILIELGGEYTQKSVIGNRENGAREEIKKLGK